jgi:outer membrane lipoprotein carrier protein
MIAADASLPHRTPLHRGARGSLVILFVLTAFCPAGDNAAAEFKTSEMESRFERAYRDSRSLEVSFLETYKENGQLVRSEAGTGYFRRPGKMRFEYEAPEKNLFLVDGKTAWYYVPSDHTATRVPVKQSTDWRTPLALLAGEARLSRICSSVQILPNQKALSPDGVVLQCVPKGGSADGTDMVFLEVSQGSGNLSRVEIQESGGVAVEFQFKNWQFNPPLPDSQFRFTPPPGTAIVNGESLGVAGLPGIP